MPTGVSVKKILDRRSPAGYIVSMHSGNVPAVSQTKGAAGEEAEEATDAMR